MNKIKVKNGLGRGTLDTRAREERDKESPGSPTHEGLPPGSLHGSEPAILRCVGTAIRIFLFRGH